MIEQLQEMEVSRQEMKLQAMRVAFEKAQAVKHNCDYEELKSNLDKQQAEVGSRYLVSFSSDWAVWQEAWQAAQEQMIKNLYTRKMVCAIENRVQEQMDASGVQEPLHRLDGWTIVDSIVENINFPKLLETHVWVPKEPTFQMYQAFKDAEEFEALSFADRFKKSYKAMLEAANQ